MTIYAIAYVVAAATAVILTPLVIRLARAWKLVDRPGARKMHAVPVPRIGGLAVVGAMTITVAATLLFSPAFAAAANQHQPKLLVMVCLSLFLCGVGLVDDIIRLGARMKLLLQVLAALAACAAGIRVDLFALAGTAGFELGWWSWPVTVVWIVGVTNAVNIIDGLDGLAAGIAAITCGVIAVFSIYTQQTVMAVLMLAMLGSLSGFLLFNFNPARVFMGDSGTLFLGFFLATSSVMCATKSQTLVALFMPSLALGLPIFDTLFSIIRRLLDRRSPFSADRSHIHHRLVAAGLNHRRAVLLLYLISAVTAGMGLLMMVLRNSGVLAVFLIVSGMIVFLFRVVGVWRFRESLAKLRRNWELASQSRHRKESFERLHIRLHHGRTLDNWWRFVRLVAKEMGFAHVRLTVTDESGYRRELVWPAHGNGRNSAETISLELPVDSGNGKRLRLDLESPAGETLESLGQRLTLLARLIDESCKRGDAMSLGVAGHSPQETRPSPVREAVPIAVPQVAPVARLAAD